MSEDILTTGAAAKILDVSSERVRQLHRAGELPAIRTSSGMRLFTASAVEAFRRSREEHRIRGHR
jgi:excisionase family DNA binding protein